MAGERVAKHLWVHFMAGSLSRLDSLPKPDFAWSGSERLVKAVAREGCNHRLGAWPLRRALERLVATPLARCRVAQSVIVCRLGPAATEAFILARPGIGSTRSSQRTRQGKQHPVET